MKKRDAAYKKHYAEAAKKANAMLKEFQEDAQFQAKMQISEVLNKKRQVEEQQ